MAEVPLRDYIEALMTEREKRVTQLEADARIALNRAELALEKRLDLLNEFRQQSQDEQAKFVTRVEFGILKERVDESTGRWVGLPVLLAGIAGLVGVVAIVVTLLHK